MMQYLYLGRVDYGESLALQRELVELRHQGRIENTLLLLEHPPVLTLGRNADRSNILASDEVLAGKGIAVHEIKRGGDVTYHGPGQLVGYPIFDLRSLRNESGGRLGPVDYVRRVEEALIRLCMRYGVPTGRVAGRTGVWVSGLAGREKKIGAIGVHISRGITSHGFALNLTTDLRDFQWIVPCGIADREVTSLELEMRHEEAVPTLEQAADGAARYFGMVFEQQVLALAGIEELRANLANAAPDIASDIEADVAPDIEQLGAPMRVPDAVERISEASHFWEDGRVSGRVRG